MKKRITILISVFLLLTFSCGNNKIERNNNSTVTEIVGISPDYISYVDSLKSENDLKITRRGEPVTIVGKESKVGNKIVEVPLTVNTNLEDENIFDEKIVKVVYTAPSLDTKVCSLQTKMLNDYAHEYDNVKFYSITTDTPFAQERFCTNNDIKGLKAVSDYKYHQFGALNGFLMKENGLLARAIMILDEDNVIQYIEYVPEQSQEVDVEKAIEFLNNSVLNK